MCAYTEIRNKFPDEEEIVVVSLGTGEISKPIHFSKASNWGLAGWARPILDIITDGINDTVDHQLNQLVSSDPQKSYYRIQVDLSDDIAAMDVCNDENIRSLRLLAEDCISENDAVIDEIIAAVS